MKKLIGNIKFYYNSHKLVILIVAGLLVVAFPFIFPQESVMAIAVRVLIYMILATGLNLTNGFIGLGNLGTAGFMCIGAYTAAILSKNCGMPFFVCLIAAGILSAIMGGLIAFPTARAAGFYFSITTLGFSEIIRLIALNWISLTRGSNGIVAIPRPKFLFITLKTSTQYYYFILILLVLVIFCVKRILASRVGRAWMSIRENQDAARSLGVPILLYKALNFMTMGFIIGIGGAMMAYYYRYISPEMFQIDNGHQVMAMVNLGGLGTIAGPLLGATIISVAMETLRFMQRYRMIVYALVVLIMMWVRPQGIIGAKNTVMSEEKKGKKADKKEVK